MAGSPHTTTATLRVTELGVCVFAVMLVMVMMGNERPNRHATHSDAVTAECQLPFRSDTATNQPRHLPIVLACLSGSTSQIVSGTHSTTPADFDRVAELGVVPTLTVLSPVREALTLPVGHSPPLHVWYSVWTT